MSTENRESSARPITRRKWLKRGLWAGAAGSLTGAALYAAWRAVRKTRPDIVLITLDTTRPDHLGCYGYARRTSPHLDRFAEAAMVYDRAIAPGTWTLPSHASLFTGKFTSSHGARHDPNGLLRYADALPNPQPGMELLRERTIAADEVTLAMLLKSAGYTTGGVVGGPYLKRLFGLHKGFDYWDQDNITTFNGRLAQDMTDRALTWLARPTEQPRFLFLNYFDPHMPYVPPPEFAERLVPGGASLLAQAKPSPEQQTALYDAEILYMDHHVGRLFEGLKRLGLYDDAWIIVTADHGELLGEHGQIGHGDWPYQEVVHIPLIVKEPEPRPTAGRSDIWIQLVDILPMILDRIGLDMPRGIQGSVPPDIDHPILIESHTLPPFETDGDWLAIIEPDGMKFVWNSKDNHLLFNLAVDPREHDNLFRTKVQQAHALNQRMTDYLAALPPPGPQAPPGQIDAETIETLKGLGYIK